LHHTKRVQKKEKKTSQRESLTHNIAQPTGSVLTHSFQQHTAMSDASLLTLPVELLYRILDHLDMQTILQSLRSVCTRLYSITNSYNRYELNITSISKSDLEFVLRVALPESIISLIFSGSKNNTSDLSNLFFSRCDLSQFIRLHSLTLNKVNDTELWYFVQHTNSKHLVSLSIESSEREYNKTCSFVSLAIIRWNLRKLYFNNIKDIMQRISWPVGCRLEHLTIRACGYCDYSGILHQLPHLQKLVMRDCNMHSIHSKTLISSTSIPSLSLTTLIINEYSLSMNLLDSLFSLTPSLRHLQMVSNLYRLDSVFNGSQWEQCIRTKLRSLIKLEFFFSCTVGTNQPYTSLDSLIAPFRTPFWLEDKHWFVTCSYVIKSGTIWLSTAPINMADSEELVRCELSSLHNINRLTRRSLNKMVDILTDKVRTKSLFSSKNERNFYSL
jgi:hypothetical protein